MHIAPPTPQLRDSEAANWGQGALERLKVRERDRSDDQSQQAQSGQRCERELYSTILHGRPP
jgi:hypothetical protein